MVKEKCSIEVLCFLLYLIVALGHLIHYLQPFGAIKISFD